MVMRKKSEKCGMFSFIASIVFLSGILYLLLCLYLFSMQKKLLYYPNLPGRELRVSPADINLQYESVDLLTSDNVQLHGWFVPADNESGTLLFFHGNAGNISHRLDSIRIFNKLGLSVLIIDYRGYGQSLGRVSEEGTYRDAEAAWKYLVEERKIASTKIIVFGRSLGGAIAARQAVKNTPAAVILESVFTSVPDMAAKLYPVLPVRLLSRFCYDAQKDVEKITCPVLIIHSPADEIIPFENGLVLFESAREPKFFLKIRGGHNDGFMVSGSVYENGLQEFVNRIFPSQSK